MGELPAIELTRLQRLPGGDALQHLEAVGRDHDRPAGLVEAVVGAADPLEQAGGTLGCPDLDHEIDIAPVDAEIERGGADDGAQAAPRHHRLDLAALLDREAAVMQRDRQIFVIFPPQRPEHQLGLGARVDEDEHGSRRLDQPIDLRHRIECEVPRPGHGASGHDHPDVRGGARLAPHDLDRLGSRRQEPPHAVGMRHRGAETDDPGFGRQPPQAREPEAQKRPPLALGDGVQLVEDDDAKAGEVGASILVGEQKRQGLGRREQKIGRMAPHPRPPVLRRVAGPCRMGDRQLHLGERCLEVAGDVGRERLERRDVEGMETAPGAAGSAPRGWAETRQVSCRRPWVLSAARHDPRPPARASAPDAPAAASLARRASRRTARAAAAPPRDLPAAMDRGRPSCGWSSPEE